MTDFLGDTPVVARSWCPGCEPDADPTKEILDIRWCANHIPSWSGEDDSRVTTEAILSGSAEAGGADNRSWCDIIHKDSPARKGEESKHKRKK